MSIAKFKPLMTIYTLNATMYIAMDKLSSVEWLYREMNKRGWSQSDLARATHITRGAISSILNGINNANPKTCRAIAKAFNLPEEEVLEIFGHLTRKKDESDPMLDRVNRLIAELPPDEQEEILAYVEMRLHRWEKRSESKQSRRIAPVEGDE